MIRLGRVVLSIAFLTSGTALYAQNNCLDCHLELEDEVALAMSEDVHAQANVSCVDCHGGDAAIDTGGDYTLAMDPAKGFIGVPSARDIPQLCGRCHSDATFMHRFDPNLSVDQEAQYWTSVHGQRLRAGATDVAQCASCHGAHGVMSAKDPRSPVYPTQIPETCGSCHADPEHMKPYGIPTDQLADYRAGVHGRALFDRGDLGAPTCNSCHGNHGATPPGIASVSLVCGNCHGVQKELFSSSPHREAFDAMGEPECESCHGNHDIEPPNDDFVGVGETAVCMNCHGEGEPAYEVAATVHEEMSKLKEAMAEASDVVREAGRAGMEVSEAELALIDANQALVESRNLVHAFASAPVQEKVAEGLKITDTAREMGLAALAELDYRRRGLSLSVFFIVLLVIGLYLKIKQIEEPEK
jgi:predicted CXXCH cytochrome family protein